LVAKEIIAILERNGFVLSR